MNTATTIFAAALGTEGLLVIVAYILTGLFSLNLSWSYSVELAVLGAGLAVPLLIGNHLLWRLAMKWPNATYARFSRQVVVPLCRQISPGLAMALALLSGFGEEIFFRGVINQLLLEYSGALCAALISSAFFAYVHFIGNIRRWGWMLPLYTFVGGYLWLIHRETNSLFVVFTTHATYNFFAIVSIRRLAAQTA